MTSRLLALAPSAAALRPLRLEIRNPVRGLLHGAAGLLLLSLALHLAFTTRCPEPLQLPMLAFALGQSGLFLVSALYHSAPWSPGWKARMQRVDHAMIFVKIAGSLAPLVWVALDGPERNLLLGAALGIGALGVAQKIWWVGLHPKACIPLQVAQAAIAIPALAGFADRFPALPCQLLIGVGGLYAAGLVIFLTERPRLWPGVFGFHETFHVITVVASATYGFVLLNWVAELA